MAAAAPNPGNDLLLIALVGIGAYWFMSRRAGASTIPAANIAGRGGVMPTTGYATAQVNPASYLGQLFGGVVRGIGGYSAGDVAKSVNWSQSAYDPGTATRASQFGREYEIDFSAVNPSPGWGGSVLESFFGGTGGSGD